MFALFRHISLIPCALLFTAGCSEETRPHHPDTPALKQGHAQGEPHESGPPLVIAGERTKEKTPPRTDQQVKDRENANASPGAIGIRYKVLGGSYPVILDVFSPSPARRAGVRVNDILIAVNGKSTHALNNRVTQKLLSGTVGTTVELTVLHTDADHPVTLSLTRGDRSKVIPPEEERRVPTKGPTGIPKTTFDNTVLYKQILQDIDTNPTLKLRKLDVQLIKIENGYIMLALARGPGILVKTAPYDGLVLGQKHAIDSFLNGTNPQVTIDAVHALHGLVMAISKNPGVKRVYWTKPIPEPPLAQYLNTFTDVINAYTDRLNDAYRKAGYKSRSEAPTSVRANVTNTIAGEYYPRFAAIPSNTVPGLREAHAWRLSTEQYLIEIAKNTLQFHTKHPEWNEDQLRQAVESNAETHILEKAAHLQFTRWFVFLRREIRAAIHRGETSPALKRYAKTFGAE